jgi:hypothetical protein
MELDSLVVLRMLSLVQERLDNFHHRGQLSKSYRLIGLALSNHIFRRGLYNNDYEKVNSALKGQ